MHRDCSSHDYLLVPLLVPWALRYVRVRGVKDYPGRWYCVIGVMGGGMFHALHGTNPNGDC